MYPYSRPTTGMASILRRLPFRAHHLPRHWFMFGSRALFLAVALALLAIAAQLIDRVLLRPIPIPDPERVFIAYESMPLLPEGVRVVSFQQFKEWAQQDRVLERAAGVFRFDMHVTARGGAGFWTRPDVEAVTSDFFPIIGASPLEGRVFGASEDVYPGQMVCLVSAAFRRTHFPGQSAIGQLLETENGTLQIIGVLPDHVAKWRNADVWVPASLMARYGAPEVFQSSGYKATRVMVRIKRGVSLNTARQVLDAVAGSPEERVSVRLLNVAAEIRTRGLYAACLVIAGTAILILISAWVNVALSWMIQVKRNEGAFAIKTMLGASTGDLLLETFIEILGVIVLATSGAVAFVAIAYSFVRVYPLDSLRPFPPLTVSASLPVIAVLSLLTLSLFVAGIWWRIFRLARSHSSTAAIAIEYAGSHAGVDRKRHYLLSYQVALVVLLLSYGLSSAGHYASFKDKTLGINGSGVHVLELSFRHRASSTQLLDNYHRILELAARVPGVKAASLSSVVPGTDRGFTSSITLEGIGRFLNSGTTPVPGRHLVAAGYFGVIGAPIIVGREFTSSDDADHPRVVLINQAMAAEFWGDRNPVGSRLKFGRISEREPWATIVGVVGNVSHLGVRGQPRPEVYVSLFQESLDTVFMAVRGQADTTDIGRSIVRAMERAQMEVSVVQQRPLDDVVYSSIQELRYASVLSGAFALAMVVIGLLGIYVTSSLWVHEHQRELAVRSALGASFHQATRTLVWRLTRLGVGGSILGAVGVVLLKLAVNAEFYDIPTPGWLLLSVVASANVIAVLASGVIPATRTRRPSLTALLRS
ncbi:MAG TPA: ABC transporter permease [Vicinamibacterales bacterium]|nr:ABC transporter permease [Vicinamibacterales bacterium]